MSALAASQRRFLDALYSQEPCGPGVAIYRRNLFANLGGALAAAYPVVRRLVGDAFFREASRQYVLAHPSRSGDLGDYGDGFPEFLAAYPHAAALPYLPDVARLEWACHESHGAADAPPFEFDSLARVAAHDQPRIRFVLHPSARLVRSEHPIAAIWHANQPDRDGTPERLEGEEHVIAHRREGLVTVDAVEGSLWRLAAAFASGESLGSAGARCGDRLADHLARLASGGLVVGFSLAPEAP